MFVDSFVNWNKDQSLSKLKQTFLFRFFLPKTFVFPNALFSADFAMCNRFYETHFKIKEIAVWYDCIVSFTNRGILIFDKILFWAAYNVESPITIGSATIPVTIRSLCEGILSDEYLILLSIRFWNIILNWDKEINSLNILWNSKDIIRVGEIWNKCTMVLTPCLKQISYFIIILV